MNTSAPLLQHPLPSRSLTRLSLVGHKKAEMQAWISNLPLMNAPETGKSLYQTLKELGSLALDADSRFELLEVIEPAVRSLITTLSKHTLNQPVLASTKATKVAAFIQALHLQLAGNYKTVAIETLHKLEGRVGLFNLGRNAARQQAATAIQRALAQLGSLLVESSLVYAQTPARIWTDLHALYREAVAQGLDGLPVEDRYARRQDRSTIRDTYLRTLFMQASQPHKLRQTDILLLYVHSERWAGLLQIDTDRDDSLLVCNPDDLPPGYHHLRVPTAQGWYVHSQALVRHLDALDSSNSEVPAALISHLRDVWKGSRERLFERRPCDQPLRMCLGLSATHYFMSGELEFGKIVAAVEEPREISNPEFVFALEEDEKPEEPVTIWDAAEARAAGESTLFPVHPVRAVNRSPAGYGLSWEGEPPVDLRPGDLIGVSEPHGDWHVGLLHWVGQDGDTVTAGLEILSTQARPCAVCLSQRGRDQSQYLRGMLLPAMPVLERPALLVTPAASTFTAGNEVRICLHGQTVRARLVRQVMATPSISQFEFALVGSGPAADVPELPAGDDLLDSWL